LSSTHFESVIHERGIAMGRRSDDSEPINAALKEHSLTVDDWRFHEVNTVLHEWAERFNTEFNMGLPTPVIQLGRISARALGSYRPGRNGFGLRHEITLNIRYLQEPLAEQLVTLLHEMIHQWQELYGKAGRGNYHNRQFRNHALQYGLVVDERGYHRDVRPGPFTKLMSQYGVATSSLKMPEEHVFKLERRGDSKLRKWRCDCTNVRCAVLLAARCLKCGQNFKEALPAW
jgi:hypothetical protein